MGASGGSLYGYEARLVEAVGLPVKLPQHLDTDEIMEAMMHDKKFDEGTMVFIVPTAIGKVEINKSVSAALVREIVEQLKQEASLRMSVRGIRGATTVKIMRNKPILQATVELLNDIVQRMTSS